MKKVSVYFAIFLLITQLFPNYSMAVTLDADTEITNHVVLFADEIDGEIELFENEDGTNLLTYIQDDTTVALLDSKEDAEREKEFSLIEYVQKDKSGHLDDDKILTGYVHHDHIILGEDADEYRENRSSNSEKPEIDKTIVSEELNQTEELGDIEAQEETREIEKPKDNSAVATAVQSEDLTGFALKQPVSVYANTNLNAEVLKSYPYGKLLKYRVYSKEWYEATVYINGKAHTGYIYAGDVGKTDSIPTINGIALNQKTAVYGKTAKDSAVLKSYSRGQILKYKAYDKDWFTATVYINGKAHTGFIHTSDVETATTRASSLQGVAVKNPTKIYSKAATNSKVLKSYNYGNLLKYRSFTKDWYVATVYLNGKAQTGYIHKSDVGSMNTTLTGYAQNHTSVYSKTSKSSSVLKSYAIGSTLKYRPYNGNWYVATVYVNGKKQTGYIHKGDVGANRSTLTSYAIANPTTVYAKTSKSSKKLKSYKKGSKLKYKYENGNWYSAKVSVNGKWKTGYIHKNDVGDATKLSFVNPKKTYTYNHMSADIKKLAEAYPELITYKVVGKSEYGRNLYAVSLGKGKATTFINGSLHAREWISTNLNMYMLENYAKAYRQNKSIGGFNARKILNETTIWFMPMVNPDGVTLQQKGLSAFPAKDHASLIKMNAGSKNFKRWKANAKGVDLNRNFSVDWYTVSNNVGYPNYQNHKGSAPASAKETKAVINFLKVIKPQMTINYHTSGEILYWGYNQKGSNYTRDYSYAKTIANMTGYTIIPYGGYPSGGGFLQYFTETYKRPSITPELSPYAGNTNVPVSRFTKIWSQNKAVGLYAAQESAKLYKK